MYKDTIVIFFTLLSLLLIFQLTPPEDFAEGSINLKKMYPRNKMLIPVPPRKTPLVFPDHPYPPKDLRNLSPISNLQEIMAQWQGLHPNIIN